VLGQMRHQLPSRPSACGGVTPEALVRWMELVEVGEHRVVARIAASVCLSVQAGREARAEPRRELDTIRFKGDAIVFSESTRQLVRGIGATQPFSHGNRGRRLGNSRNPTMGILLGTRRRSNNMRVQCSHPYLVRKHLCPGGTGRQLPPSSLELPPQHRQRLRRKVAA